MTNDLLVQTWDPTRLGCACLVGRIRPFEGRLSGPPRRGCDHDPAIIQFAFKSSPVPYRHIEIARRLVWSLYFHRLPQMLLRLTMNWYTPSTLPLTISIPLLIHHHISLYTREERSCPQWRKLKIGAKIKDKCRSLLNLRWTSTDETALRVLPVWLSSDHLSIGLLENVTSCVAFFASHPKGSYQVIFKRFWIFFFNKHYKRAETLKIGQQKATTLNTEARKLPNQHNW